MKAWLQFQISIKFQDNKNIAELCVQPYDTS